MENETPEEIPLELQQNATKKRLPARQEKAAFLVAEDVKTDEEISDECEIDRSTLHRWRQKPEFKKRVNEHIQVITERVISTGVARVDRRVSAENKRWLDLHKIIEEQSTNPKVSDQAGGGTGLIFSRPVVNKAGDIETEYFVHTPLLAEIRNLEVHVAKELGQYVERIAHKFDPSALSDEELEAIAGG
jgi:hypothetical protein